MGIDRMAASAGESLDELSDTGGAGHDRRILCHLMKLEGGAMDGLFALHQRLLHERAPLLAEHLNQLGIAPQLYLVEWVPSSPLTYMITHVHTGACIINPTF